MPLVRIVLRRAGEGDGDDDADNIMSTLEGYALIFGAIPTNVETASWRNLWI
jgi:hypothetical protein